MKKVIIIVPVLILVLSLLSSCNGREKQLSASGSSGIIGGADELGYLILSGAENSDSAGQPSVTGEADYPDSDEKYTPDYNSENTLHADTFFSVLENDGYFSDGVNDKNYNTGGIKSITNITPTAISDDDAGAEIFLVNGTDCFLKVNNSIYRYDTFGGYHRRLCMWDYDNNGVNDIVSYDTFGSGIPYLGVYVFDLTQMRSIEVVTRNLLDDSEFTFEFENGAVYLNGEELTFSGGGFHCAGLIG